MVIIFLTGIQSSDNAILAEYFSGVESIIMSSSLSVAEKKVWLSGLSIGRASTNYWIDYDLGNR